MIEIFYKKIFEIISRNVPLMKKRKNPYPSWFSLDLKNEISEKKKSHKEFLELKTNEK